MTIHKHRKTYHLTPSSGFAQVQMLLLLATVALASVAALAHFGQAQEHAIVGEASASHIERDSQGGNQIAIGSQAQAGVTRSVSQAAKAASRSVRKTANAAVGRLQAFGQRFRAGSRLASDVASPGVTDTGTPAAARATARNAANASEQRYVALRIDDSRFRVPEQLNRFAADEMQWHDLLRDKVLPDFRAGAHEEPGYVYDLSVDLLKARVGDSLDDPNIPEAALRAALRKKEGALVESHVMARALVALAKRLNHPEPNPAGWQRASTGFELTPDIHRTLAFGLNSDEQIARVSRGRLQTQTQEATAFALAEMATRQHNLYDWSQLRNSVQNAIPADALAVIDGLHEAFSPEGASQFVREIVFEPGFWLEPGKFKPAK